MPTRSCSISFRPSSVRDVRAIIDAEAAAAGRIPPRLTVWVPVALDPGDAARANWPPSSRSIWPLPDTARCSAGSVSRPRAARPRGRATLRAGAADPRRAARPGLRLGLARRHRRAPAGVPRRRRRYRRRRARHRRGPRRPRAALTRGGAATTNARTRRLHRDARQRPMPPGRPPGRPAQALRLGLRRGAGARARGRRVPRAGRVPLDRSGDARVDECRPLLRAARGDRRGHARRRHRTRHRLAPSRLRGRRRGVRRVRGSALRGLGRKRRDARSTPPSPPRRCISASSASAA